ncbi:UDP-galactopyranose mutase [Shewanella putrefaciens]|nr:UDP-galactopyranose mutase [Shewanella putrefaciens]
MSYQAVVIGAGFSGAVMAEQMASQLGWKVLVLEHRNHIAGNCYDEFDEKGVLIHRYGPHIFHTDNQVVWDYLSRFTAWRDYEHRVLSKIDGALLPIPFNLTSIQLSFTPDKAAAMIELLIARFGMDARIPILTLRQENELLLSELAEFIYQKVFVNYTSKQWGVSVDAISPEVTARVPIVVSYDDRYFIDSWQAVPEHGYTELFNKLLGDKRIDVCLSTPMKQRLTIEFDTQEVFLDGELFSGPVIYTGTIDSLFDDIPPLPYRSLRFEFKHVKQQQFQPVTTVNYPNEEAFTRITEFKLMTGQRHPGTTVVYEYPLTYQKDCGLEPYYPMFTDLAQSRYQLCRARINSFSQIIAVGRLAEYRYYDMDDAVANALAAFERLRLQV